MSPSEHFRSTLFTKTARSSPGPVYMSITLMRRSLVVAGNQGLIVKYATMPASAICFALVGGGLMVPLRYERTAFVA